MKSSYVIVFCTNLLVVDVCSSQDIFSTIMSSNPCTKVNISIHKENLILIIYTGPTAYAFYRIINHSYVKHVQTDGQHSVKAVKNLRTATVHVVASTPTKFEQTYTTILDGWQRAVFGFYVIPVTGRRDCAWNMKKITLFHNSLCNRQPIKELFVPNFASTHIRNPILKIEFFEPDKAPTKIGEHCSELIIKLSEQVVGGSRECCIYNE